MKFSIFQTLALCAPSLVYIACATSANENMKNKCGGIGEVIRIMQKDGLKVDAPFINQKGYSGVYLNGNLSKAQSCLNDDEKARFLIYLLEEGMATEFDGEVAFEFKHVFYGKSFENVRDRAMKMLRDNQDEGLVAKENVERVGAWLNP